MDNRRDRLTYEELRSLRKRDPEEFDRITYGSKQDFIFGVERGRRSLIIVLNRKFEIRLDRDPTDFPLSVAVDEKYGSQTVVHEDKGVIFYISEQEFQEICRDAEEIYLEYGESPGRVATFCRLPDVWFKDTKLVRFLRERVVVHPMYREWNKRIGHIIVGT